MAEETHNNYRQLESNPDRKNLDPAVSEKNSAENAELLAAVARIQSPKDEESYTKDFQMLQGAAANGWPVAQLGLTRYFREIGAFQAAQKWSDSLAHNQWVGKSLMGDVNGIISGKEQKTETKNFDKPKSDSMLSILLYLFAHKKEQNSNDYKEVRDFLVQMADTDEYTKLAYAKVLRMEGKQLEAAVYFQSALKHATDQRVIRDAQQALGLRQKRESKESKLQREPYKSLNANAHKTRAEAAQQIVASKKMTEQMQSVKPY